MKESIARIKARGKQFDSEFSSQYEVPIEEAVKRLGQVPGASYESPHGFHAKYLRTLELRLPASFIEASGLDGAFVASLTGL